MNHIHKLQADLEAAKRELAEFKQAFSDFRVFLHGPKFTGFENGERKDWISTGDVINWLREVERAVPINAERSSQ